MPLLRGREPTSSATLTPSKAAAASSLMSTPSSRGNAPSSSSMATPAAAPSAGVISSRRRRTGWSAPSISPEAMRNSRL